MKNKKLTVIVPCYNTEKYLKNFFINLKKQSLNGFEVIFVDDCSKDHTLSLLQEECSKHSNYKLIHNEKNSGAGYSRNIAIKNTESEYIIFLDADDIFPEDYLEKMYTTITKEKSELAVCDMQVKYDDSFGYRPEEYNKIFPNNTVSKIKLLDTTLVASPTNKIFKKELIERNLFAEGIVNEDIPSVIGSIIDAKSISYVKNTYYTYVQHGNSVQNSSLSPKKLDVFKAIDLLYERKRGDKWLNKTEDALIFHQLILLFFFGICQEPNYKIRKEYIKKFFELSSKYNFRSNQHYWKFIDNSPKLVGSYYKSILKAADLKQYWLSSLIVSMYKIYKKLKPHPSNSVIKPNININAIRSMAIKNQKLLNPYGSISVVVPNFNYAAYLYRRIYSILNQKIKIEEIIILDDCSSDNSIEIINELVKTLSPIMKIKKVTNKMNSGCVYKQWQKGFQNAKSDFVWIAEADDYSNENFLDIVMKPFAIDEDIRLSYTDTSFMLVNGQTTLYTMNPLIDIMKTGHWDDDYINSGVDEIENYCFLNCTIANASSVIFRNYNYDKEFEESTKYKQVGDWLFYVNVMKKGKIAYTHQSLNYCCIHEGSSTATMKKIKHFNEIKELHEKFKKEYNISPKKISYIGKRYQQLYKQWDLEFKNGTVQEKK